MLVDLCIIMKTENKFKMFSRYVKTEFNGKLVKNKAAGNPLIFVDLFLNGFMVVLDLCVKIGMFMGCLWWI